MAREGREKSTKGQYSAKQGGWEKEDKGPQWA